ncbi:hypothetical protein KXR87_13140 [Yokenella regensburgei]|uniref:hypothetical protein n=1 Tax=Yokenella regensburgei TaxID=158877 RepID=UPI003F172C90
MISNEQIQALKAAAEAVKETAHIARYTKAMVARQDFKEAATPEAILSLLAEREADKALIAELRSDVEDAEHRRDMTLKNSDALFTRIIELESRKLIVKLPNDEDGQPYGFSKWANHKLPSETGTMTISRCEDSWREAFNVFAAAAGITLVVEE